MNFLHPARKGPLTLALFALLLAPAGADQLYVRNRPFKGAVVQTGSTVWVEAQAFADALEVKLVKTDGGGYRLSRSAGAETGNAPAGKVLVAGEAVDSQEVNGKTMIPLETSSRLLGLRLNANHALGTIDVNIVQAARASEPAGARASAPTGVVAGEWSTSYNDASRQSLMSNKPILMEFTGSDWCPVCKKLKGDVFDTPEFKKWAKLNVVLLQVDFPRGLAQSAEVKQQNQSLQTEFGIKGYPTCVFVTAKGKKLGECGAYQEGLRPWMQTANRIVSSR